MWFIFTQIAGLGTSPTTVHYAIGSRAEADAFLADAMLGAGYRELVDAVWTQVVTNRVSVHTLCGSPDDHKLVSSLTLFAGDLDDSGSWARFVEQANEILDQAELPPSLSYWWLPLRAKYLLSGARFERKHVRYYR